MSETKTTHEPTGNFIKALGMKPTGEIEANPYHTTIENLKSNLQACRDELRNCRANNNNLKKQLELMGSAGGRKRKKTKRKRRKKTKRKRRKRRKRSHKK